jgi:membrane protease YdiL (CAAX protease family)
MTDADRSLSVRLADPLVRLIGGTAIVFAAIAASGQIAALAAVRPYLAPVLLLYLPLFVDGRDADIGWRLGPVRGWLAGLLSGVVILGAFYLVTRHVLWGPWGWPADGFGRRLAVELLFAAIPEETFYRGWLLPQLDRRFGGRGLGPAGWRITYGNLVVAAVFASLHLADAGDPARLATFFPGLWFGWAAQRAGYGIGPAVALHALSNVAMAMALAGP